MGLIYQTNQTHAAARQAEASVISTELSNESTIAQNNFNAQITEVNTAIQNRVLPEVNRVLGLPVGAERDEATRALIQQLRTAQADPAGIYRQAFDEAGIDITSMSVPAQQTESLVKTLAVYEAVLTGRMDADVSAEILNATVLNMASDVMLPVARDSENAPIVALSAASLFNFGDSASASWAMAAQRGGTQQRVTPSRAVELVTDALSNGVGSALVGEDDFGLGGTLLDISGRRIREELNNSESLANKPLLAQAAAGTLVQSLVGTVAERTAVANAGGVQRFMTAFASEPLTEEGKREFEQALLREDRTPESVTIEAADYVARKSIAGALARRQDNLMKYMGFEERNGAIVVRVDWDSYWEEERTPQRGLVRGVPGATVSGPRRAPDSTTENGLRQIQRDVNAVLNFYDNVDGTSTDDMRAALVATFNAGIGVNFVGEEQGREPGRFRQVLGSAGLGMAVSDAAARGVSSAVGKIPMNISIQDMEEEIKRRNEEFPGLQ